jgi:hypothetical protein
VIISRLIESLALAEALYVARADVGWVMRERGGLWMMTSYPRLVVVGDFPEIAGNYGNHTRGYFPPVPVCLVIMRIRRAAIWHGVYVVVIDSTQVILYYMYMYAVDRPPHAPVTIRLHHDTGPRSGVLIDSKHAHHIIAGPRHRPRDATGNTTQCR